MSRKIFGLVGWLLAALATGAVGAVASRDAAEFYGRLVQPDWAPPSSVFGPVWTALYILMGIAAGLVWRQRGFGGARAALVLFVVQLVFNALWSWLFFAWHQGGWALAEIAVLWLLIAATLVSFWRVSRMAGVLLLPYLAWVSFATVLTWSVWRLNPGLL